MREDRVMVGDAGYLSGLSPEQAAELARVNAPGLTALREYLASGQAVAFLGAGVSAPLYPLWDGLISELVEAAGPRLTEKEAATCRALARESPESVVEIVRQRLGVASYREVLREVLRVRVDPESGRSWTAVQELVCRCTFQAVVTTNYDPGIVNARMRVRQRASATGFATWQDELELDRWRTGEVFGEDELPVLFAHGQHNKPDSIVLATTEYRWAYAGKLPQVLGRLMDGHLVWIGFSFADQRIGAILREIANHTGTRIDPGGAPRHVAVMAWDPASGADPGVLAQRAEIEYGAQLVLYPAPGGDHSALGRLLAGLADDRYPPVGDPPPVRIASAVTAAGAPVPGGAPAVPVAWIPTAEPVEHFTGRAEELARLDRWAADPQVALVGVTAWGGAGKTALVTRWVLEAGGTAGRSGVRGVFGWSFYADASAEHWARELLEWARRDLGVVLTGRGRPAEAVLAVLRAVPVLLVLDGLEVMQEGLAGGGFGRLLDGTLREVLAGVCQQPCGGLVLLTSRFPFADLEGFDGDTARMLEVPPLTPAEGSALLAAGGGGWLPENQRRDLVRAVDGHALATEVLAVLLAEHPPASDLAGLRAELDKAARTDARVGKVLEFYRARLAEPDRYLLAAVSLFARPTSAEAVLAVAAHEVFGSRLDGWTPAMVQAAVTGRLGGLASWHPDGAISAHPLVRDMFRRLVMDAAGTAAETSLAGMPSGTVTSRADALRVIEAIELLLDAGQWQAADDMYENRSGDPPAWITLPAARLGQRAATAFVATPTRRDACDIQLSPDRQAFYLNEVGLFAKNAGDMATGQEYLSMAIRRDRDTGDTAALAIDLHNQAQCLGQLGQPGPARDAAAEALTHAQASENRDYICYSHAFLGWVARLAGDTAEAEQQFIAADEIEFANGPNGNHLFSLRGTNWAEWLACTGREGPARVLTLRNADICRQNGWNDDLARCDRMLARLALTARDTAVAGQHLAAAAGAFRDGDYLPELAITLADLASCAQAAGDLGTADRHSTEAIALAAPRGLVPAQAAALAARACIRADQAATAGPDLLYQGRDAADAALRLATRHQLAWHELDALRAHAALDRAEGVNRGWAAKARDLHARLVPPGLDPDPLATVERLVAAQKAAEKEDDGLS
jgi:SIR2-like protein